MTRTSPALMVLLAACNGSGSDSAIPDDTGSGGGGDSMEVADIFVPVDRLGDPAGAMPGDLAELYARGQVVMEQAFKPSEGLGPTFNADSCAGCHQFPVAGGSSPRYRDFWLVKSERWDGALEDAGSNGQSPVRNFYATHPTGQISEPEDTALYARRSAPSGLGVGLFEFIPDEEILSRVDEDDADGDGISGRANYEQNRVGRLGYKSQASSMESFNRGAMLNQMGLTSNPLFYEHPGSPFSYGALGALTPEEGPLDWLLGGVAHAQVSAPGQPTSDSDGVADPELSDDDQLALLVFSTWLAPPEPVAADQRTAQQQTGAELFADLACDACHTPALQSTLGLLPAYSDLLLHDMGEARGDGLGVGLATGTEFRTQPLWGATLHEPFLHDGAADTLAQAILMHGGEGQPSADGFEALGSADQEALIAFLESLGGSASEYHFTDVEPPPAEGEPGGPVAGLDDDEHALWAWGRQVFDRNDTVDNGLGAHFNADACRACHQDPVLGGAGGIDTSVLRFGAWSEDGESYDDLGMAALPRVVLPGEDPVRLPDATTDVELRQPPTVLGLGLVDGIADEAILALEDPDDLDGDGVSGRARILSDGRLGKYGWKAQIPTVLDFVADAGLNEIGVTIDPELSDFTVADDGDEILDPEMPTDEVEAVAFFLLHTSPPARKEAADAAQAEAGEALFEDVGCAECHTPSLDGVALYSDLLLHDVVPAGTPLVDQEAGLLPSEFRTPPLWGLSDTRPYLHNGRAETPEEAILLGHDGEAAGSRLSYEALSDGDQAALRAFLDTL